MSLYSCVTCLVIQFISGASELGDPLGDEVVELSVLFPVSLRDPLFTRATEGLLSFSRFFCFILLFWNQILTCVSFRSKEAATSTLRALVRYLLK